LSPPSVTRAQALSRMERIGAVTHLASSLEHLARPGERRRGGMNNWDISRDTVLVQSPAVRRVLDVIGRPSVTTALHGARVLAAGLLVSPVGSTRARAAANTTLACTSLALHPRHHYGTDGSDQVGFLVQSAAALARGAGSRTRVVDAALWAVALQSTMSYAVSGWAKLAGPTWRHGLALEGVCRTMTYGDERAYRLVRRFPRTARVMGAGVLALECTFPLVYLAGGRLAKPYVAGVTLFHLSVARVMALGRFVPAFLSMHSPVLYTVRSRASTAADGIAPYPERSDTVARLVVTGLAAVAASAGCFRTANARTVLAGRGDEQVLTTSDGNRLVYRTLGVDDPQAPVYVLESALLSTPEHWEWVAQELATTGRVVTYERAGYAASTAAPGTALTLDDLVGHTVEMVEHVADGRPVVLVGHSLGGYLALKAAGRLDADLRTVVLVDSSHPDELRRSQRQARGAEGLTAAFPLMLRSLDLGLGMLLEVPDWVKALPIDARRTALAKYRDSRLWRAARREWAATLQEFEAEGEVPTCPVPVLVLSAERTITQDETHGEMQEELAAVGPDGRHEVVRGADHDTILSVEPFARHVAARIRAFTRRSVTATEIATTAGIAG
jgi:pimeloyl-ACP methyl ester carboxylesterase